MCHTIMQDRSSRNRCARYVGVDATALSFFFNFFDSLGHSAFVRLYEEKVCAVVNDFFKIENAIRWWNNTQRILRLCHVSRKLKSRNEIRFPIIEVAVSNCSLGVEVTCNETTH